MTRATALAALAGILAAAALVELWGAAAAARRAAGVAASRDRAAGGLVGVLTRLGRRAGGAAAPAPARLQARLDAAGVTRLGPGDVVALRAAGMLLAALTAPVLTLALPPRAALGVLVLAPAAAFAAPDLWLRRAARQRNARLTLEVADVLELLAVTLAAGAFPARAMAEVGRRRGGVLGGELAAAAARMALGVAHAEALARLAARCPVAPAAALAAALERAVSHGTPPAPALRALALDARAARTRALQEQAARAAPKIQLVVALVLVPGVLLLLAAALLAGRG